MAYSTPKSSSGIGLEIGVMSPVADTPVLAGSSYRSDSSPQLQAEATYSSAGFKGWMGAKAQKFSSVTPGLADLVMRALEIGASYSAGVFGVLANVQGGTGLGIVSDADQGDVKSLNYLAQATFKASDKLKLGLSYGLSENDDDAAGTGGLKSNANLTLGAYYALNSAITLVAEVGQTRSKGFDGASARMNGVSLGGIIFF
jgi:hypothetical protein